MHQRGSSDGTNILSSSMSFVAETVVDHAQAFEQLIQRRVLMSVGPPSATVAKDFVVYRCTVDSAEVKSAVNAMGQTNLKKWLAKGQ
jgi:hypothetical protein